MPSLRRPLPLIVAAFLHAGLVACAVPAPPLGPTAGSGLPSTDAPTRVALITDFGSCDEGERWATDQIRSWQPAAIVTGGDNTQEAPCAPYSQSVWGYLPKVVDEAGDPAVWTALGNHDLSDPGAGLAAYRAAFPHLPTDADPQQRWYHRPVAGLNLFVLDSEVGPEEIARQRDWLARELPTQRALRPENWNVVVLHRPPFTSGAHEPNREMRPAAGFDYRGWGADLVVSGHQHVYEDVVVDGLHYVTAGIGGSTNPRTCGLPRREGSRVCLEGTGVALVQVAPRELTVAYTQRRPDGTGFVADRLVLTRP